MLLLEELEVKLLLLLLIKLLQVLLHTQPKQRGITDAFTRSYLCSNLWSLRDRLPEPERAALR